MRPESNPISNETLALINEKRRLRRQYSQQKDPAVKTPINQLQRSKKLLTMSGTINSGLKFFSYILPIKALLGMLARLPWGRRDVLGSMNGKYEGVYVKYASLIVSCQWIKVVITT